MIISRKKYNELHQDILARTSDLAALHRKYGDLEKRYEQSVTAHTEVVQERNDVGALLLDCLTLLSEITITTKQRGGSNLIVRRNGLMERAKGIDYLPKREEKEESHAQDDPAVHQASSSEN